MCTLGLRVAMMAMTDPVMGVIACVASRDVATGEWMKGRFVMMVISIRRTVVRTPVSVPCVAMASCTGVRRVATMGQSSVATAAMNSVALNAVAMGVLMKAMAQFDFEREQNN